MLVQIWILDWQSKKAALEFCGAPINIVLSSSTYDIQLSFYKLCHQSLGERVFPKAMPSSSLFWREGL